MHSTSPSADTKPFYFGSRTHRSQTNFHFFAVENVNAPISRGVLRVLAALIGNKLVGAVYFTILPIAK